MALTSAARGGVWSCDCPHLPMVDNQLEEGVHQEDSIRQDAAAVQENGLEREDGNT